MQWEPTNLPPVTSYFLFSYPHKGNPLWKTTRFHVQPISTDIFLFANVPQENTHLLFFRVLLPRPHSTILLRVFKAGSLMSRLMKRILHHLPPLPIVCKGSMAGNSKSPPH